MRPFAAFAPCRLSVRFVAYEVGPSVKAGGMDTFAGSATYQRCLGGAFSPEIFRTTLVPRPISLCCAAGRCADAWVLRTGAAKAHHAGAFAIGGACVFNAGLGSHACYLSNPPPNLTVNRTRRFML